jgi:6-phosphogluconolactonase (cycloisomerase 2 family)
LTLDIAPANHYFYTLNEGYISMFKLDIASGSISSLSPSTVSAIRNPLNMVISPNSKFIYELSETYSNNKISIYNVDLATGQLTATGLPSATKDSV